MKKLLVTIMIGFLFYQVQGQNLPKLATDAWKAPHTLKELADAPVPLIPFPQKVSWTKGSFTINKEVNIFYEEDDDIKRSALSLQTILKKRGIGSHISQVVPGKVLPVGIVLRKDHSLALKKEGYHLKVSNNVVELNGVDVAGVFYGIQTIAQLIQEKQNVISLPACEITDWPAFSLRGFMYDTGRNFREIKTLKEDLDQFAAYKFNTFHWHLTDNPAWRPESKIFPQLNDPKLRRAGRDEEKSYSFDEIRDLIKYAAERHIKVIPELDMPGHSAYFEPTFGFTMGSEKGMVVLEKLIDEFCSEISVEDCPIIHIGADEVHIANPDAFMQRMSARLKANGRQSMSWNPGLKPEKGTIEQLWSDEEPNEVRKMSNPFVDSYAGYLNSADALTLIRRYFFQQPCNQPEGDSLALGGILCSWPDTRVIDKNKIAVQSPIWPGMITYSEAIWCGRPTYDSVYMAKSPDYGTNAWAHFKEFENRLVQHRDSFFKDKPFPFVVFSDLQWNIKGVGTITGGVMNFDDLVQVGQLKKPKTNSLTLTTFLYSDKDKDIHAWIGFETAARSTRKSAGLPKVGEWDANGGHIMISDKVAPAPVFDNPGGFRYLDHTWGKAGNEVPFTDEEFYWSRKPAKLTLKKGWNKVEVLSVKSYKKQDWMFAFVPVQLNKDGRWVEDLSVISKPSKP